ncbi:hypothetical protein G8A07_18575 [Roseateles sp. DAIF2]|uniref:hypothetical protein n=1 Tax=Roseateles sp. DAIF2 TaxID=2714952 RepID=UPI0018A30E42|nr:hypothetical protein [Roseateles sp. DAIF2]QPF74725.1 hypothetical protein G8A07_18575 [Roseateles sp. DAIF2]
MTVRLNALGFKAKLPELPKTLPVHALQAPDLGETRRAAIGRLAERLKLGSLREVEFDHGLVLASERGDITHFRASGGLWARDATAGRGAKEELRQWDGLVKGSDEHQRLALSPEAGRKLLGRTRELLEPLGLLGKELASESVQLDQVAQLDAKGREIAHGAGQASVRFHYAVAGLPVRGAGAKTLAFVEPEEGGRYAGIFHAWRPLGREQKLQLPGTVEEALGVGLLTDPQLEKYSAAGHKIQIDKLELVYLALPVFTQQTHLFPAFQIEGQVSEGKLGIGFFFGRYHHVASPKAYAAADLYGACLSANPDGIAPQDKNLQVG